MTLSVQLVDEPLVRFAFRRVFERERLACAFVKDPPVSLQLLAERTFGSVSDFMSERMTSDVLLRESRRQPPLLLTGHPREAPRREASVPLAVG